MKYIMVHGKKIRVKMEETSLIKEFFRKFVCKLGFHRTHNDPLHQKVYCWYCRKYLGVGWG